jgi:UDP-N-acetylglucosamine--N-acetylmuramyl-(pentapeptide) pyrophosphoryl-undecaprenol N-acetylglucosamine transferase
VVVSSAGQSSVVDIAAAAIVIPEPRPFEEQYATASALAHSGSAVTCEGWPSLQDWPALLDQARAGDELVWRRWQTRDAAIRAAAVIERVAASRSNTVHG